MRLIKIAIFVLQFMLFGSCISNDNKEKIVYDVINTTLNEHYDEVYKKHLNKDSKVRIDPEFSSFLLSKDTVFWGFKDWIKSELWIIDYISKFATNCENKNTGEYLNLVKDSTYYKNQAQKGFSKIDINKISNKHYELYRDTISTDKGLRNFHGNTFRLNKEEKEILRQKFIKEENGTFKITYPLISKDNKHAIIFLDGPGQLWVLENKDGNWVKNCNLQLIYY